MSGIRTAVLTLLLASAGQDPSLDSLIEQLSDDRVELREAAVESLVRLGPARLPDLRKRLDGLPAEPKGRLAAAIARIEESVRLLEYFPPYRPVSLHLTKVPARDALKELADRTGLPINLSTCPAGREVTVQVENLPPLQALTEVCKAAMIGWQNSAVDWRGRQSGSQPAGIRFHHVVPYYYRPMAIQFVRHYKVSAHLSTVNYTDGVVKKQLSLAVQPAAGVRPHSVSGIRLTEATDEKGQDVLANLPSGGAGFATLRIGRTGASYSKSFPAASPPEKLTQLKGTVTFRYPREVRWVRFRNPGDGAGPPETAWGCQLSLLKYERKGTSHEVVLGITGLVNPKFKARDVDEDLPFDYQEVELVTASGERLTSSGCTGFGGDAGWEIHLGMKGTKDEAAVEVRIPWADKFIEDEVQFDLRDVVHQ